MSQKRYNLLEPPAGTPIEVHQGKVWILRNKPWMDWFNSIFGWSQQLTVSATLDFPNTNAQTSSELTVSIAITGVNVPVDSFIVMHEPVSPNANTCFTARMTAANEITVRFNNYSAGAINPGELDFDFLIFLKKA